MGISYHLISGQYFPKKCSEAPPVLSFPRAFCGRKASVRVAGFAEDGRRSEKVGMGICRWDGEAHGNAAPCLASRGTLSVSLSTAGAASCGLPRANAPAHLHRCG